MYLVTGGAGFLGEHLVEGLVERAVEVRSFDVLAHGFPGLNGVVDIAQGDVCDAHAVASAVQGCDVVIHNAALVPITRSGVRFREVNVEGTRTVLEECLRQGVRKVVYISSSAIYGVPKHAPLDESTIHNPFGLYGKSKAAGEDICDEFRARGLDITKIRPRPILGPRRLGILELLFDRVRAGRRFFLLGKGENLFQLASVHDVVHLVYLAASKPSENEDFNIGAEQFGTLRFDLEGLVARVGSQTKVVSVPERPVRLFLAILDILHLSPVVSWHYKTVSKDFWYPSDNIKRVFGWVPERSNADCLHETYDWYLKNLGAADARTTPHLRGVAGRALSLILRFI